MYSIIAADCLKIKTVFFATVSQMQGSLANCHLYQSYALINFVWYRKKNH